MLERIKALAMPKVEEVVTLSSGEEVSFHQLKDKIYNKLYWDIVKEEDMDPDSKLMMEQMGFAQFTAKWQNNKWEEEEMEVKEEKPTFRFLLCCI